MPLTRPNRIVCAWSEINIVPSVTFTQRKRSGPWWIPKTPVHEKDEPV